MIETRTLAKVEVVQKNIYVLKKTLSVDGEMFVLSFSHDTFEAAQEAQRKALSNSVIVHTDIVREVDFQVTFQSPPSGRSDTIEFPSLAEAENYASIIRDPQLLLQQKEQMRPVYEQKRAEAIAQGPLTAIVLVGGGTPDCSIELVKVRPTINDPISEQCPDGSTWIRYVVLGEPWHRWLTASHGCDVDIYEQCCVYSYGKPTKFVIDIIGEDLFADCGNDEHGNLVPVPRIMQDGSKYRDGVDLYDWAWERLCIAEFRPAFEYSWIIQMETVSG